jgi:hypothetical protein
MIVTIYNEGEIERNVEVHCNCGAKLDVVDTDDRRGTILITVDPCEKCLDKAKNTGYNEGYDEGGRNEIVN